MKEIAQDIVIKTGEQRIGFGGIGMKAGKRGEIIASHSVTILCSTDESKLIPSGKLLKLPFSAFIVACSVQIYRVSGALLNGKSRYGFHTSVRTRLLWNLPPPPLSLRSKQSGIAHFRIWFR